MQDLHNGKLMCLLPSLSTICSIHTTIECILFTVQMYAWTIQPHLYTITSIVILEDCTKPRSYYPEVRVLRTARGKILAKSSLRNETQIKFEGVEYC